MVKVKQSSIQKCLIAAGARPVKLSSLFKSKNFSSKTISESVDFELPELDEDLYKIINTDEGQTVYIGPRGLWYKVDGIDYSGLDEHVDVFDPVFGDNQESLQDSVLAFCMDKFYNSAIINHDIVKPVDFPLYALLERGNLSVTSKVNDDAAAFREQVWNITLDHIIDHWRVPLMHISRLRDVYNEWATWRKGMLAPGFDDGSFDLRDETLGLSFEDQEIIEHLKYNKQRFVDDDLDRGNVYLPHLEEIEAVDMLMYSVEQLQDDGEVVFPSRIGDIARAWSQYEEAHKKAINL